jgi:hypothetical protein
MYINGAAVMTAKRNNYTVGELKIINRIKNDE